VGRITDYAKLNADKIEKAFGKTIDCNQLFAKGVKEFYQEKRSHNDLAKASMKTILSKCVGVNYGAVRRLEPRSDELA